MSKRSPCRIVEAGPRGGSREEQHWIEIFADRVTEDLKQILQEDMDWTTSLPILERLNRLQEIEQNSRENDNTLSRIRKAS